MVRVIIWPTSDAGSWIPAGRAIVNGVPLTPTVIDPGPTPRTGAWIVTEVVCPTTCIGPAFNCRAEVTVAVVFTIIPLIGLWSTTEASARPVWTATRLRSPARNVVAPARRTITAWMRTWCARPITRTALPRTALPLTRTRAPTRACTRVRTVWMAPPLAATASDPDPLPTTTPLKAANAPLGKIAAAAATTARLASFFITGLLLASVPAPSRVRRARKLARLTSGRTKDSSGARGLWLGSTGVVRCHRSVTSARRQRRRVGLATAERQTDTPEETRARSRGKGAAVSPSPRFKSGTSAVARSARGVRRRDARGCDPAWRRMSRVSGTCSTLSLGSRARSQQSRLPGDRVHHQAVQLDLLPQPQPLADLCDQGVGHGESLRPMTRGRGCGHDRPVGLRMPAFTRGLVLLAGRLRSLHHRRRRGGGLLARYPARAGEPALRVVILTAEVGEGHVAAARVLAAELVCERADVEVLVCDALVGLGRFLRYVLLDAYRGQLRFAPWIFGLLYGLFARFRALRGLGRAGLAFFGARSLLRFVNGWRPDIVVSTYPAATSVLGSLRRRGRLTVPDVCHGDRPCRARVLGAPGDRPSPGDAR